MFDRRERNTEIFRDTENRYSKDNKLKEAVKNSIEKQKLILEYDVIEDIAEKEDAGNIVIREKFIV